jgi:hypothetical protein
MVKVCLSALLGPQARDGQSTEQAATPTSAHRAKSVKTRGSRFALGATPRLWRVGRASTHFGTFGNFGNLGQIWQIWPFLAFLQIFRNLVKFDGILKANLALWQNLIFFSQFCLFWSFW